MLSLTHTLSLPLFQADALAFADVLEQAYPCQDTATALRLRKKRKHKAPTPPSAADSGVHLGKKDGEVAAKDLSALTGLVQHDKRGPRFALESLSDVRGAWLAPPLQMTSPGMDVDTDQELFYAGTDSPHYNQAPLAWLMAWDAVTRARVLAEGDPSVVNVSQSDRRNAIAAWQSFLDRAHVDRLADLVGRLCEDAAELSPDLVSQLNPSEADSYTRKYSSRKQCC